MYAITLVVLFAGWSLTGQLSMAGAQPSISQQRDGTTGTLSPLGGNDAIYSDAHGNRGVTHLGAGLPSHTFSSPHGAMSGTVTPFGMPAPLLPLRPGGMAAPQPQAPTSFGAPPGFDSFSGQPGR